MSVYRIDPLLRTDTVAVWDSVCDSGGEHTAAKLDAARARGLPVVLVRRPRRPAVAATVATVAAALAWARAHAG